MRVTTSSTVKCIITWYSTFPTIHNNSNIIGYL